MPDPQSPDTARRATLPAILRAEDVAELVTGTTPRSARRLILSGALGPYLRLGRRLVVRRETMLAALEAAAVDPRAAVGSARRETPPIPKLSRAALAHLLGRKPGANDDEDGR